MKQETIQPSKNAIRIMECSKYILQNHALYMLNLNSFYIKIKHDFTADILNIIWTTTAGVINVTDLG